MACYVIIHTELEHAGVDRTQEAAILRQSWS